MKQFLELAEKCQSSVERCAVNTRQVFFGFLFRMQFLKVEEEEQINIIFYRNQLEFDR